MATKQQIPVLAGSIVSKQEGFSVLSTDDAQWAIENPEEVIRLACEAIRTRNNGANAESALAPVVKRTIPSAMTEQLVMWKEIYTTYFGLSAEDRMVFNPDFPAETDGFGWLVVVKKGLTIEAVVAALKMKMKVWRYTDNDLDQAVPTNERIVDKDYAVIVRDRIEADEELRNTSANQIAERKLKTMTLLEHLLLELFVFHFTGEHLDVKCYTICAGSRNSDGYVPRVCWDADDGGLRIGWCDADDRYDSHAARAVQVAG